MAEHMSQIEDFLKWASRQEVSLCSVESGGEHRRQRKNDQQRLLKAYARKLSKEAAQRA